MRLNRFTCASDKIPCARKSIRDQSSNSWESRLSFLVLFKSEITTCVALVAVTVSVEELPCAMVLGLATIVTVGAAALAATVTLTVAVAAPPAPVAVAV